MTPTRGGRRTGSAARAPRTVRPGNSQRWNTKASGVPMSPASVTLARLIHTLAHRASSSDGVEKNSR